MSAEHFATQIDSLDAGQRLYLETLKNYMLNGEPAGYINFCAEEKGIPKSILDCLYLDVIRMFIERGTIYAIRRVLLLRSGFEITEEIRRKVCSTIANTDVYGTHWDVEYLQKFFEAYELPLAFPVEKSQQASVVRALRKLISDAAISRFNKIPDLQKFVELFQIPQERILSAISDIIVDELSKSNDSLILRKINLIGEALGLTMNEQYE